MFPVEIWYLNVETGQKKKFVAVVEKEFHFVCLLCSVMGNMQYLVNKIKRETDFFSNMEDAQRLNWLLTCKILTLASCLEKV